MKECKVQLLVQWHQRVWSSVSFCCQTGWWHFSSCLSRLLLTFIWCWKPLMHHFAVWLKCTAGVCAFTRHCWIISSWLAMIVGPVNKIFLSNLHMFFFVTSYMRHKLSVELKCYWIPQHNASFWLVWSNRSYKWMGGFFPLGFVTQRSKGDCKDNVTES